MTNSHRRARRSRAPRLFFVVITALVTVLALGGVAVAYFTATGSGAGSATTGTLNAPTAVSGAQVPGANAVNVTWTAPVGGAAPTGYYVLRTTSPGGPTVAACGTSALMPITNTSCLDASVPAGSYTYVVVAVFASWTATSAPSALVTVVEVNQTITFVQPVSPVNALTSAQLVVSASSGLPVTVTPGDPAVCTVSGTTVNYLTGGSCVLTATQPGNGIINPAAPVVRTVVVNKLAQAITFNQPPTPANAGTSLQLSTFASASSGLPVVFSTLSAATICTITGTTVNYVGAGSCVISANQPGNAVYQPAIQVQRTVVVQAVDGMAPVVQLQYPGSISTTINNGQWTNNGCTTVGKAAGICGTATDNVALAAGTAQYQLRRVSTNLCWNGTDFTGACNVYRSAAGSMGSWSIPIAYTSVPSGTYELRIRVVDAAGNSNRAPVTPSGALDLTFTKP